MSLHLQLKLNVIGDNQPCLMLELQKNLLQLMRWQRNLNIRLKIFDNSNFLNKVIEQAKAKQLDSQLSRHAFDLLERTVYTLSIHQLMFEFCKENNSADNFIKFTKEKMFENLCKEAEEKTRPKR